MGNTCVKKTICLFVTHRMFNMLKNGGLEDDCPFNWVFFGFQPFIFRGEG